MKTRFWGWLFGACLCLPFSARAQLVVPPYFTWISLPSSATQGDTVSIGATAQALYSDNSDGNDWNAGSMPTILRVTIDYLPPGGSWTNLNDWMPSWVNPNTANVALTLDTPGTWYVRFQSMDGRPWYSDSLMYSISVAPTVVVQPGPVINSALSLAANQGEYVWYQITATNNPTSYSASGLPAGLSFDQSSGVISGYATSPGNFSFTITASNMYGSDSETLSWSVYAASIVNNGSVDQPTSYVGTPVLFTRDGSANFGVAWTEGTIWRPDGTQYVFGSLPLGSTTWTPDGGVGTYWWQYRIVDPYYNYSDQWISFTVNTPPAPDIPSGLTATGVTASGVSFGWNAVPGAAGYLIFRNGAQIDTVTSTSYIDSGLTSNTSYSYAVVAFNSSGQSAQAVITLTTSFDPNADSDGDGVPDSIEALLGTNPNQPLTLDTGNVTGLKVNKPQ